MVIQVFREAIEADFMLLPELLPKHLRPHVRAFGRFVRLADAVTDNAFESRSERIRRLDALERALSQGTDVDFTAEARVITRALQDSLATTGVSADHALHLVQAFRRDLLGRRTTTWSELMDYCRFAAAPVGRYLLELTGEDVVRCGKSCDALFAALRILRQLREFENPTVEFNRLCVPEAFMEDAMVTIEQMRAPKAKGQIRAVLDRLLDGVERLLTDAAPLPSQIRCRGLRIHMRVLLCRGRKLVTRFRDQDPLRERIGLTSWERRSCRLLAMLGEVRHLSLWRPQQERTHRF